MPFVGKLFLSRPTNQAKHFT